MVLLVFAIFVERCERRFSKQSDKTNMLRSGSIMETLFLLAFETIRIRREMSFLSTRQMRPAVSERTRSSPNTVQLAFALVLHAVKINETATFGEGGDEDILFDEDHSDVDDDEDDDDDDVRICLLLPSSSLLELFLQARPR